MNQILSVHACRKCQRTILVERTLIGVDHDSDIRMWCWDCMTPEHQDKAKKLNPKIIEAMNGPVTEKVQIETDDRTVWVHRKDMTVARFCPVSAEIMGNSDGRTKTIINDGSDKIWKQFQQLCSDYLGIQIPDAAKPTSRSMKRGPMREVL